MRIDWHFIRVRICGVFLGLLLASPAIYLALPIIQVKFYPIIKMRHIANSVTRDDKRVCWDTEFEKLQNNIPRLFDYKVEFKDMIYSANTYRLDADGSRHYLSISGFSSHTAGETWISKYCIDFAELPKADPPINPFDAFEISGEAYYGSKLWVLRQMLPSFVVPGVPKVDGQG